MGSASTRWRFVSTSVAKKPTERVYYGFYIKTFAVRESFGGLKSTKGNTRRALAYRLKMVTLGERINASDFIEGSGENKRTIGRPKVNELIH
jgi:hypothetical protein